MKTSRQTLKLILGVSILLMMSAAWVSSAAAENEAELRVGYIYLDEDGFNKQQQSFNLYEGPSVSLENLRYTFASGARLTGDFKNMTLNNRNVRARLFKSAEFGLNLTHSKYRRLYTDEPDRFTRRETSDASVWFKPHRYLKFYGGFGQTDKFGETIDLFEPDNALNITPVDYRHQRYHVGLLTNENGRTVQVEYRGATFDNNADVADQRTTERFRALTMFPVPRFEEVVLNGGFQHFENTLDRDGFTMSANSAWGGARVYFEDGLSARYSFVFDRAQNTNDLIATDNIAHAFGLAKRWPKTGLSAGYRTTVRDDIDTELSGSGVFLSGWTKAGDRLTLKGDFGSETTEVERGSTLTGDKDQTRYRGSATYRLDNSAWYARYENRRVENDDIGSMSDYARGTFGMNAQIERYGQIDVSYVTAKGEYENSESTFEFVDHTLIGDLLSKNHSKLQLGFGAVYYRSDRDIDIESVSLRFKINYSITDDWRLEGMYDGRNYDDLQNPGSYYTANIVEINVVKKFSAKED